MSRKIIENLKVIFITFGVLVFVGGADSFADLIF